MQIFVGNLSFEATEKDVRRAFSAFGAVSAVTIVTEKNTDKSRGFGFVDMPDQDQAMAAIAGLNAREFMGRPLNVNPARPRPVVIKPGPERGQRIRPRENKPERERPQGKNFRFRRESFGKKPWHRDKPARMGGFSRERRESGREQSASGQGQQARPAQSWRSREPFRKENREPGAGSFHQRGERVKRVEKRPFGQRPSGKREDGQESFGRGYGRPQTRRLQEKPFRQQRGAGEGRPDSREEGQPRPKQAWYSPVFKKQRKKYAGKGRRSRSYRRRQGSETA